jgi:hypothetical protein
LKLAKSVEQLLSFSSSTITTTYAEGTTNYTINVVSLVDSHKNIFGDYVGLRDEIMDRLESGRFDVVVLSLGPTATVMAAELSCRGYWAIDVGQFGGNYIKMD